jgi:hypothetical protein
MAKYTEEITLEVADGWVALNTTEETVLVSLYRPTRVMLALADAVGDLDDETDTGHLLRVNALPAATFTALAGKVVCARAVDETAIIEVTAY